LNIRKLTKLGIGIERSLEKEKRERGRGRKKREDSTNRIISFIGTGKFARQKVLGQE